MPHRSFAATATATTDDDDDDDDHISLPRFTSTTHRKALLLK
jgi:hypothetical protein